MQLHKFDTLFPPLRSLVLTWVVYDEGRLYPIKVYIAAVLSKNAVSAHIKHINLILPLNVNFLINPLPR